MTGLTAILLLLALDTPALPGALEAELTRAEADLGLPVSFAEPLAGQVSLAFHDRRAWARAWFAVTEASGRGVLHLSIPHYVHGIALRPIHDMQPDTAEYLFHALLEARLGRELARGGDVAGTLRARSRTSMQSVPSEHRLEAYVDGLASFGSHVLSLYGEIARLERRRRREGAGRSLCDALGRRAPLFRLWEVAFSPDARFPGSYALPPPGGRGVASTRWTDENLTREERSWFVGEILEVPWSGDADMDLGPLVCGTLIR